MRRKVCVLTGSRSEYGILRPVLFSIRDSPSLELSIIVTGMHLSPQYGYTISDIENDGLCINAKVDMMLDSSSAIAMAKSVGIGVIGLSQVLETLKPDIIVVAGDRIEPLALAIAATYMNIPIAHIHGGDKSIGGHVDDSIRHVITKMAQIHFAATEESGNRIVKMGEESSKVFVVGAPALDTILNEPLLKKYEICRKYNLNPSNPIIMVIQNPVTREVDQAPEQMKETMEALINAKLQTIIIYPNSDMGGRKMIDVINEYKEYPFITILKNMPHNDYLSLMKISSVLVGNSSSAIIEAPSFKIPVINIGSRQEGRERSDNVIDVPYDRDLIGKAIHSAIFDERFIDHVKKCKSPYGDGHASERIVEILSSIEINPDLLRKKITY
jgi:UDP-N-acetylglucosamine 2-epimerase (non-hydrolysing)/GDP/UDP-N,N'-diacetylbacillosamine 2-epimerase (hydrolysing)